MGNWSMSGYRLSRIRAIMNFSHSLKLPVRTSSIGTCSAVQSSRMRSSSSTVTISSSITSSIASQSTENSFSANGPLRQCARAWAMAAGRDAIALGSPCAARIAKSSKSSRPRRRVRRASRCRWTKTRLTGRLHPVRYAIPIGVAD